MDAKARKVKKPVIQVKQTDYDSAIMEFVRKTIKDPEFFHKPQKEQIKEAKKMIKKHTRYYNL